MDSPIEVNIAATKAFGNFHEANRKRLPPTTPVQSPPQAKWSKPPPGYFKVNCDTSFLQHNASGGLGYIIRDSLGRVIAAVSQPSQFTSPLQGEALAPRTVLLEAISETLDRVHVESDNRDLILYLENPGKAPPSTLSPILEDIRFIASQFETCLFFHISRDINSVANYLAQKASSLACRTSWSISTAWLRDLCNSDASAFAASINF
ncbi:uncharacterized protein LOC122650909 [Telopea speciosissima]|uniref:uncharacterized protein LOC122650909 n=1 Tax=Telopea speciosissima TaxID=54955 RepID=UPI001CC4939A|nr:uncharacterized protein LOC122650909 [Telopea speciosissima]